MTGTKSKKRVGVLRGGAGEHYQASLKRGGEIIAHIFENLSDKYKVSDILIDKDYIWHMNGLPISPSDLPHRVDVVWNTTHPSFSNILDSLSIPNIGASSFSSALGKSKEMLRKHMAQIGISMPRSILLPVYQADFSAQGGSASGGDGSINRYSIKKAKEVFEKFGSPWIVKSFTDDADMGVHLAQTFNQLAGAIEDGVRYGTSILVEEFIPGKVASLHSVSNFREQDLYIFPPVDVFGNFSFSEKEKLSLLVKDLRHHLGEKHYLKSNFVLDKRGKVYLLELNSTPNLKPLSHFWQACESVGAKMHHVVEHILEQA